ncbi:MAG: TonB-dependent receptor [Bacteroides sp.]|nr:TonB-dependent receptor [Bacteroides sp.]
MKPLKKVVDDAKVRVSYGSVGNNRSVNDFSYLMEFGGLVANNGYMVNGQTISPGMLQFFLSNSEIKWEKTTELDLGLDIYLLNNRIALSFDYYKKIVTDLILSRKVPYYLGYGNGDHTRYENAGSTMSEGVEVTLLTTNIKNKKFGWNSSFNFSFNKNTVRKFYEGLDVMTTVNNDDFSPNEVWMA